MNQRISALIVFNLIFCLVLINQALAAHPYHFDAKSSAIHGAIRYTVIGQYKADFQDFEGSLLFDPQKGMISSVALNINTVSVKSRYPKLDRIVRSRYLLDVAEYPDITFKSKDIIKKNNAYLAKGLLKIHGVEQEISFPFDATVPLKDDQGKDVIRAQGTWIMNRKDFKIIWNKILDHGGIIVSEHITINWEVLAFAN